MPEFVLVPLLERGGTLSGWRFRLRAMPITLERPAPSVEKDELTAWLIIAEAAAWAAFCAAA